VTQTPAGWYTDPTPERPDLGPSLRWWDGARWTEHVTAAPPTAYPAYPTSPAYPAQPYAALPATTPDGQPLAGWWIRVGAYLLDGLIMAPISVLLGWPFVSRLWSAYVDFFDATMRAAERGAPAPSQSEILGDVLGPMIGIVAVSLVVNFVYNVGFLKWKQATPGKLIVGLRVRLRERPGPMSWGTVLLRWIGQNWNAVFSFVPLVGSIAGLYPLIDDLWPLWDDKNQALHDKVAKTNVVRHRRGS
jgi:uncharacterized RDD family membrane protein YckC